ncbi:ATP synthase F(0) complex subunit B1 [Acropora cervicornis]|uniref:ATP synthase subunit b n=1 Tax=Acropora cervicornis TaxID=6130 RepID=A0AAD9R4W6_ACRCE|nr:ATP synthase F(0) complex subunit B1 [Acropora cervicornis]
MCQVPQVKGQVLLIGGFLAYSLSKELLVIHDETVLAVVMGTTLYFLAQKVSKPIADMLDARYQENNAMSLELDYRNKLHEVVREVKKRLDYQAEIETFQRRTEQLHIIDWVEREVVKSITPQLEKESVSQCIKDLKAMTPA